MSVPVAVTAMCSETQLRGVTKGLLGKLQFCDKTWVTDPSWKCADLEAVTPGWTSADYDDSSWAAAETVSLEVGPPGPPKPSSLPCSPTRAVV